MQTELRAPRLSFGYETVDIRDFDGERLLESPHVGDNVIAILTRLRDRRLAVQRILLKIADLDPGKRESALSQLLRIAGLRRLEEFVEREARTMPVFNPIMDNKVLGREIKRGMHIVLRRLIEDRFGPVPDWAVTKIDSCSAAELETLCVQLLHVQSLEELLR
jgi:hypothetical protein